MATKKVDVRDLKSGMYVARLDRPWEDTPFLFQGFRIEKDEDLRQLQSLCRYVHIDPEQGYDGPALETREPSPEQKSAPRPARKEPAPELLPEEPDLKRALPRVHQYRQKATGFLDNILKEIRAQKAVNTTSAAHVVDGLVRSVKLNLNASLWLNSLKARHEHSANHCTNVGVVSLAFAHHLGYSGQKLIDIGIGALLHDVGLMRLPVRLLDKPGKLTPEEEKELQEHTEQGERLLQRNGAASATVLNIVRHHHERVNGKGYPDGLSGKQVPEEAMIVALADIYDAMTTERPYKTPSSPHGSMNVIRRLGDSDFPPFLVQEFMTCIGIYPISTLVQLNNGSVALVVGHTRKTRLRPEVMMLKNGKGQTYRDWPLVDLDKLNNARNPEQWQIMRVVDPSHYGIDVAKVTQVYMDRLYGEKTESA